MYRTFVKTNKQTGKNFPNQQNVNSSKILLCCTPFDRLPSTKSVTVHGQRLLVVFRAKKKEENNTTYSVKNVTDNWQIRISLADYVLDAFSPCIRYFISEYWLQCCRSVHHSSLSKLVRRSTLAYTSKHNIQCCAKMTFRLSR